MKTRFSPQMADRAMGEWQPRNVSIHYLEIINSHLGSFVVVGQYNNTRSMYYLSKAESPGMLHIKCATIMTNIAMRNKGR